MAIREQGYTAYKADLHSGGPAWWVLATNGFRLYWGLIRTKLLFIALMVFPVVFTIMTFAERLFASLMGAQQGAEGDKISGLFEYAFGYVEVWMLAIMLAAAGCGVIADDIRYKTVQLYFSKPIKLSDYIAGKFLSLVMLGSLVTLLPTAFISAVRLVVFSPSEQFKDIAQNTGALFAFNLTLLVVFPLIVMALSSLTRRSGYAVLSWLATILVPSVVATVVQVVRKGEEWPELLSIVGNLAVALQVMTGFSGIPDPTALTEPELPEYMTWVPWLVLASISAGAYAIVHWRTSKLEDIA